MYYYLFQNWSIILAYRFLHTFRILETILDFYALRISTILPFQANYISWMPNLVFGVLGITGSILAFWLPETRHRALPQTVAEMEHWKTEAEEENKCYNCECFKRRQSPWYWIKMIIILYLQFSLSVSFVSFILSICVSTLRPRDPATHSISATTPVLFRGIFWWVTSLNVSHWSKGVMHVVIFTINNDVALTSFSQCTSTGGRLTDWPIQDFSPHFLMSYRK